MYDPNIHHRKSIRLKHYDYSQNGCYFVTICTQDKLCWFGNIKDGKMELNNYGNVAEECLSKIPDIYENTVMDCHIVMPNHIHFIIQMVGVAYYATPMAATTMQQKSKMLLPKIIQQYKTAVTKELHNARLHMKQPKQMFKWQRNYYEHIIRNEQSLDEIRKYINENPVLWDKDTYFVLQGRVGRGKF